MDARETRERPIASTVLVVLAVLLLAAPAHGATDPLTDQSWRIAEAYWGQPPCGQPQWRLHERLYVDGDLKAGVAMIGPTERSECAIHLAREIWDERVRAPWRYCSLILHEWGHLMGREHDDERTSIMFGGRSPVSGRCIREMPRNRKQPPRRHTQT